MFDKDMAEKLLRADFLFQQASGVPLLKSEAKVILLLKKYGPLSIKEAMSFLDLSYRGFYILLNRMITREFLTVTDDDVDKRVKRINIKREIDISKY